jgi:hypothetical protein
LAAIVHKKSVVALAELLQNPKIAKDCSENYSYNEGVRRGGKLDHESEPRPIWDILARTIRMGISGMWRVLLVGAMLAIRPGAARAAACRAGLVVREAAPGDLVCVTPESRRRAAADNARAPLRWVPGPFGPKTCAQGFVWRLAFASDQTCVTPEVRTATLQENRNPSGDPTP